MVKFIFTLIFISINVTPAVNTFPNEKNTQPVNTEPFDIEQIKNDMKELNLSVHPFVTPSIKKYFQFYDIDFNCNNHYFGTFKARDKVLATHIFLQENSRGTFFLLHGYNDHSGILKNLIHFCFKQNFSVAIYDLPGHGLSSGEKGAITDFSEYADIHKTFISIHKNSLPKPFHLIGHSTGCAIAFEYLNKTQDQDFEKIIFLAPLVHPTHWRKSKIGYSLIHPIVKSVPRVFRKNSSDLNFLEFIKNDPLQNRRIPLKFLTALKKWDKRIKQYDKLQRIIYIIQGRKDSIIDWKYNIKFLKQKIERVDLKIIENARHQLVNEKVTIRTEVFEIIEGFLEQ